LSRPLVAGTLAGTIVGYPMEGALVGALLEAISLSILPVGASRYPETGTAAVAAAGALGLSGAAATAPALLLALMFGLLAQRAAGATVRAGRYVNEHLVQAGRPHDDGHVDALIEHRHLASMALDIIRGILVTAVALAIGVPLIRFAVPHWGLHSMWAALAVAAAGTAVLAGTAPLFTQARRDRAFMVAGLVCGCVLLLLR
ncbi:MAG TPA: PTS sugar transporter subunit IIC, partial [Longimicrobiales bacterium]|nr:PTS sugar transporter subunit IIC [Longimicrobiales bacterium]